MYEIIKEILFEEKNRSKIGGREIIPMRPDHGHLIGDEVYKKDINPGYDYGGRLKGLGELRGVIYTLDKMECQ
jgi:mannonate dehydratase